MPDKQQPVDGFSDTASEEKTATRGERAGTPGSPDPGEPKGGSKPMDPEEFARMKKEASEEDSKDSER